MLWSADQLAEARDIAVRAARRKLRGQPFDWADDIAQETVIKLAQEDPDSLDNWRAWTTTVASRAAVDMLRDEANRGRREAGYTPRGVKPTSAQAVQFIALAQLLSVLTDRESELFRASVVQGLSNGELAERFGYKNAASVAVTLTRIRQKLKGGHSPEALRELAGELHRVYDPDAWDYDEGADG